MPRRKSAVNWPRAWANLRNALRPPSSDKVEERNAWLLQVEIFWAGLLSAMTSFGSNFAVRLGASNRLIGLMSSVPALLVVLLTMPAARLIESRRKRLPWIAGSLFLHRLMFFPIALMPLFIHAYRAEVFVGLVLFMNVLLAPFNAGWSALLGDLVPERKRAYMFARRNIIASGVVIVAVPLIGRMLDRVTFPLGYQIAYGVGFIAAMISAWFVWKLQVPEAVIPPPRFPLPARERARVRVIRRLLAENADYIRITANTLVFGWGAWMVGPLYIIYYLRHLGASDSWVGTLTAVANLSAMIGYYTWQKLIGRWGESRALRWTAPTGGLFPLWAGLSRSLSPILAAAMVDGLLMPGVNLAHFNTLLKVCPVERRASYISFYTVIMNAGAFVGPLIGVALADRIGIANVLFLGAAIRTIGGLMFSIWPARVADTVPGSPSLPQHENTAGEESGSYG